MEFDNPVPAGKSCNVDLNPRLKTLSGLLITGQKSFLIDTGGPTARAIMTGDGYEAIEEDQIFLVATNVAADRASVTRFGYCAVDGMGEKIPLNVLPADPARDIINRLGASSHAVQYFASNASFPVLASASVSANSQSLEQIIPVQCQRPLPPGRDMALVWDGRITQQGVPSRTVGRDQRVDFRVRSAFTAKMACSRVNAQAGCNPIKDIVLRFSSPIPRDAALASRLYAGTSANLPPQLSDDEKNASHVTRVTFRGPLPQNTETQIILPADVKDQSGRPLANRSNFPMRVKIDAAPPLAKFAADFGILEASEGGVLPITVRAVEPTLVEKRFTMPTQTLRVDGDESTILDWMRKVQEAGRTDVRSETNRVGQEMLVNHTGATSLFQNERMPSKQLNLTPPSGGKEFEVIGIPLSNKGFHVVKVASPALGAALLGRKATRYVAAAALVTDIAVHFKWGREQNLAWVTSLKDGTPISGADLRVVDSCSGKLLSQGKSDKWGRFIIPSGLPQPSTYSRCDEDDPTDSTEDHGLMVSARLNGDFSFTLTDWGDGIRPYDFDLPYGWSDHPQNLAHYLRPQPRESGRGSPYEACPQATCRIGFFDSPTYVGHVKAPSSRVFHGTLIAFRYRSKWQRRERLVCSQKCANGGL